MKYLNLLLMGVLSFISMFILMYLMVNQLANVYVNLNQVYMAGVMTTSMILLELFFMRAMYSNKMLNISIGSLSLMLFLLLVVAIRNQTGIEDKEFLRSMIPHHAAAISMCEQASLQDPDVKVLCDAIVTAQQEEIDFMKAKLASMKE